MVEYLTITLLLHFNNHFITHLWLSATES